MKKPTATPPNHPEQTRSTLEAHTPNRVIALFVFCSGLCALVYQMTWLREFRLIFGASTAASAAVLAIFMGGLGAGSIVFGRRVDRLRNPFRFYGQLELIIALTAALTPALLWLARHAYIALGGTLILGIAAGTILRLILAALVLLVPTFLMGGTLPAVVNAVRAEGDERCRKVALLYGANTLGAVTGALIATFFLFEWLGNRLTLWSAAVTNLALALTALRMARRFECPASAGNASAHSTSGSSRVGVQPSGWLRRLKPALQPAGTTGAVATVRFVLGAAAVAGFAFFLMELVWSRMLGPILGGSTFTFGLILAIALLGIASGSLVYSLWRGKGQATLAGFAAVCALEALFMAVPYALGDRLALLAIALQPLGSFGFAMQAVEWSVVTFIVVFPTSVVAGFQFPMLIALLESAGVQASACGRKAPWGPRPFTGGSLKAGLQPGANTGLAYGWNTAGAIAGSLAGGFGLLPVLTAPGAWRWMVVLLVGLSVVALWV